MMIKRLRIDLLPGRRTTRRNIMRKDAQAYRKSEIVGEYHLPIGLHHLSEPYFCLKWNKKERERECFGKEHINCWAFTWLTSFRRLLRCSNHILIHPELIRKPRYGAHLISEQTQPNSGNSEGMSTRLSAWIEHWAEWFLQQSVRSAPKSIH